VVYCRKYTDKRLCQQGLCGLPTPLELPGLLAQAAEHVDKEGSLPGAVDGHDVVVFPLHVDARRCLDEHPGLVVPPALEVDDGCHYCLEKCHTR